MERIFGENGLDDGGLPELTDKPRTGKYRVRDSYLPRFSFPISRADVAGFMLNEAENDLASRKIVGVAS